MCRGSIPVKNVTVFFSSKYLLYGSLKIETGTKIPMLEMGLYFSVYIVINYAEIGTATENRKIPKSSVCLKKRKKTHLN